MQDPSPDLRYSAEHEWIDPSQDPSPVGITLHAAEELGEIVYVELPSVGDTVTAGDSVGEIESTKAVSELYVPVTGEIVEVNEALADAPERVGEDPYGEGWLFKIRVESQGELMDAAAYEEHANA